MATTVKVTTVGNSVCIVLPKEILTKLNVSKGDTLYVTETPDGLKLTPYDEHFVKVMEAANQIMRENRDVLRKLAK
jgi:putative addiction module antidote